MADISGDSGGSKIVTPKKTNFKVTFVCRSENLSGGQRVIAIYADSLTRRGHDVTVVVPDRRSPSVGERVRAFAERGVWPGRGNKNEPSFLRNGSFKVHRLAHFGPVTDRDLPDADLVIAGWWETAEWVMGLAASKG